MALQGGNQTDEDFIFDQADDQPGQDGGTPNEALPEDFAAEPVDSRMVSEAIRGLIAPSPAPVRAQPAPVPAQPQADQQRQQPQDDMTPRERGLLRDLQEERARRREYEDRANGRQPAGQQPQQPRDLGRELFENPEQVLQEIRQDFGAQIAQVRLTSDLEIAQMRHPEVFQEAFDAFMAQVGTGEDARTYHRIMTAPSPGNEIVNWFRENTVLREVGNDPASYRERVRQEILAEMQGQPQGQQPAPRAAAAAEAPRAPNGQFQPRSEVRLPTAVGRMAGGKSAANMGAEDGSDDAIFNEGKSRSR